MIDILEPVTKWSDYYEKKTDIIVPEILTHDEGDYNYFDKSNIENIIEKTITYFYFFFQLQKLMKWME